MNKTDLVDRAYLRDDLPAFRPGDTLKVHVRVVEAGRERIQVFQGVVIRRQGGGLHETFTVRKVSFGVGVERTFPVHSPSIAKMEVEQKGRVRRAKLYYLRERRGKRARIKERREVTSEVLQGEPGSEPEGWEEPEESADVGPSGEEAEASESESAPESAAQAPELSEGAQPQADPPPEGEPEPAEAGGQS